MTLDEQADTIYRAYPRKVGKKKALASIKRALREVEFGELLAAVREYAACRKLSGQDQRFTPHPATWFNGGRWDDDRNEWRRIDGQPTRAENTEAANGRAFAGFLQRSGVRAGDGALVLHEADGRVHGKSNGSLVRGALFVPGLDDQPGGD